MNLRLSFLILLLAPCSLLHADKVALTRAQASELYVALATTEAGLSPANTVAAADNLNALRPHVESLDKGKVAYQRALRALAKSQPADAELQVQKLTAELEGTAEAQIKVDLAALNLSDEEIANAKVKPAGLAVIRRWLLPQKK